MFYKSFDISRASIMMVALITHSVRIISFFKYGVLLTSTRSLAPYNSAWVLMPIFSKMLFLAQRLR